MKIWIIALLSYTLCLGVATTADAGREEVYARMDEIALSAPPEVTSSVAALTDYLIAEAKTDLQKARVIYRWITHNIHYDANAYISGRVRAVDIKADAVLRDRTSVCDGYARLFEAMAKHAGLKAERITGTVKGYSFEPGLKIKKANHAWNAVELEGAWYLLDTTWGAGYVDFQSRSFVSAFNEFFFLPAPDRLKFSHHPEDSIWQLLEKPIGFKEFAGYVDIRPAFFQNGMGLIDATTRTLNTKGDLDLRFKVPAEAEITAILNRGKEALALNHQSWQRTGDTVLGKLALPTAGRYELQVFAKQKTDPGKFSIALIYQIDSKGASRRTFPLLHQAFFNAGLELVSHQEGIIQTKSQVDIILANPNNGFVTARLLEAGEAQPLNLIAVQRRSDTVVTKILLPFKGKYQLQLFVSQLADQPAQLAAEYTIVSSEGAGNQASYPQFFSAYLKQKAELVRPFQGTIKSYHEEEFKIKVPGADRVAIVVNNEWHYLTRENDVFTGIVPVTSGVVKLVGSFGEKSDQFQVLAQFDAL